MHSKKTFLFMGLGLLVFALLMACATGQTIRDEDVAKLKQGMSEEEVTQIIGLKPFSRNTSPDGSYHLQWVASKTVSSPIPGMSKSERKDLVINFGPDRKMRRITHQSGF